MRSKNGQKFIAKSTNYARITFCDRFCHTLQNSDFFFLFSIPKAKRTKRAKVTLETSQQYSEPMDICCPVTVPKKKWEKKKHVIGFRNILFRFFFFHDFSFPSKRVLARSLTSTEESEIANSLTIGNKSKVPKKSCGC